MRPINTNPRTHFCRVLRQFLSVSSCVLIVGVIPLSWSQDETSSASYEARKKRLEELRKQREEPTAEQANICDGGVVLLGIRSDSVLAISNFPETSELRQRWDANDREIENKISPCRPLMAKRYELESKIFKNATPDNLATIIFLKARSDDMAKLELIEKQLDACFKKHDASGLYEFQAVIQAEAARQVAETCN